MPIARWALGEIPRPVSNIPRPKLVAAQERVLSGKYTLATVGDLTSPTTSFAHGCLPRESQ